VIERIKSLLEMKVSNISPWQRGFLESILEQAERQVVLSHRQIQILEECEFDNSEERVETIREWQSAYGAETRQKFDICMKYYDRIGYFSSVVSSWRFDDSFIPTEQVYKKVCENKYTERVLESHFATPKYKVGDIIQFRSTTSHNKYFVGANGAMLRTNQVKYATVVESDALPVLRAAKGSKIYSILPFGAPRKYYVHESDIKKARGLKK